MSLTLTPRPSKSNQFTCTITYIINQSWWNSVHWFVKYVLTELTTGLTEVRPHGSTHGRTTWKHNASDTPIGGRRHKTLSTHVVLDWAVRRISNYLLQLTRQQHILPKQFYFVQKLFPWPSRWHHHHTDIQLADPVNGDINNKLHIQYNIYNYNITNSNLCLEINLFIISDHLLSIAIVRWQKL